jgi:hypothetical protein
VDTLPTVLSLLGGLLLRLALPLAATVLTVWLLRRLDARWQREAEQQGWSAAGMPLATPCWQIRQCSAARRADCPAYQQSHVPCWQVFRSSSGQLREGCLDCAVFRGAPVPVLSQAQVRSR